jgi:hypothetical protein
MVRSTRRFRRLHRLLVPLAAAPLLLTAASGSLYSLLLEQGIDAFWLLRIGVPPIPWTPIRSSQG